MFDVLCQRDVDDRCRLATDSLLLTTVAATTPPRAARFHITSLRSSTVRLGRFQLAPEPTASDPTPPAGLSRRLSGGRTTPSGPGFVELSIVLPHRGIFASDVPSIVAPHQIPNRLVRGVLRALRALGVNGFYPGTDIVTINRRVVAALAFESSPSGAILFEVCLAISSDFAVLNSWIDRLDPGGAVKTSYWPTEAVTSLESERRLPSDFAEIAEVLCAAYSAEFGIVLESVELSPTETSEIERAEANFGRSWVDQRHAPKSASRYALASTRLGPVEVFLSTEPNSTIREVLLAGEFLANSDAVERLQASLRGCPLERAAIRQRVDEAFVPYPNFLLGITTAELAELIARAS